MKKKPLAGLGLVLVFFWVSPPSYGYIDPGAGSFVFQMLIGALMAGIATIACWSARIYAWLKGVSGQSENATKAGKGAKQEKADLDQPEPNEGK